MARERRELARVRRLIEREQNQREAWVVPVRVEQGTKVARELRHHRDVTARIRPEPLGYHAVVITERTRVELHHEAVLARQASHLHEHVRLELALVCLGGLPTSRPREEALRVVRLEARRVRFSDPVIGGGGA